MTSVRSVTVNLKADISDFQRKMVEAAAGAKGFAAQLDSSNDRMSNLVQTAVALGPALIPVLGGATVAVGGLATSMTFAASGAGVFALAMAGIGDALDAVNTYQLDPTQANLDAMRASMEQISPAGRDFVSFLNGLRPQLDQLQDTAQGGMFPGLQEGIAQVMHSFPEVQALVADLANTIGDLSAEAGDALDSPFWHGFLDDFSAHASQSLSDLAHGIGNIVEGLAGIFDAFLPESTKFSTELLKLTEEFDQWGRGLADSAGFHQFIAYVNDTGPEAMKALGSIADAFLAIVEAGAPVGRELLPVITLLATGLADIARSPAGPVLFGLASGLAALSRSVAVLKALNATALFSSFGGSQLSQAEKSMRGLAGGVGVLGLALSQEIPDSERVLKGLAEAASGAALGLSVGGPWGAAIGGGIGLLVELKSMMGQTSRSTEEERASVDALTASLNRQNGAITSNTRAQIAKSFADKGLIDDAGKVGLTLNDLVNLSLHPTANAWQQLSLAIQKTGVVNADGDEIFVRLGHAIQQQSGDVATSKQEWLEFLQTMDPKRYQAIMDAHIASMHHLGGAVDDLGQSLGGAGHAMYESAAAAKASGISGAVLRAEQDALTASTQQLTLAQQELNNIFAARLGGLAGLTLQIESAQGAMKDLGNASKDGGSKLNLQSHAGATLALQLSAIAEAASKVTGSAETQASAIHNARDAMTKLSEASGLNAGAAQKLTDGILGSASAADIAHEEMRKLVAQYHLTPKQVKTAIAAEGATNAAQEVKALRDYIDQLHDKSVSITVSQTQINKVMTQLGPSADGNLFDFHATPASHGSYLSTLQHMAMGGFPAIGDQQPQIQPNHGPRGITWAETGAGPWEAFISGAPEKRGRSRSIADETVARLGGVIDWMANGGVDQANPVIQWVADGGRPMRTPAASYAAGPATQPISPTQLATAVAAAISGARFALDVGGRQTLTGIIETTADYRIDNDGQHIERWARDFGHR